MGITKKHFYTESQLEMASICKALGHPARITIIEKLLEYENLNCNDLRFFIPLAQSTISQHMNVLFEVGLIGYEVSNNNAIYVVNKEIVAKVSEYLQKIRRTAETKYHSMIYIYFKPQIEVKIKPT